MGIESFQVDVCRCDANHSLTGFPRYAPDQVRAHSLAEDVVRELQAAGEPGEYLVAVSIKGETPIATQVVVVPGASSRPGIEQLS